MVNGECASRGARNTKIDGFLWLFGMFYNIFLGNLAAVVE